MTYKPLKSRDSRKSYYKKEFHTLKDNPQSFTTELDTIERQFNADLL